MTWLKSEIKKDSFSEMPLPAPVLSTLQRIQINKPTPIQEQALPLTLAEDTPDLIGIAPTGSGKTLVYGLTIMAKLLQDPSTRALILTPSRETADQIYQVINDLCSDLNFSTCLVVSGKVDKKQVSQLNKLPRVIVATPGRLLEHLSNNKLLLQKMSIIVIDEADRMLDVGFEPQLKSIRSTMRGHFQTLMFGASFSPKAEKFAKSFLRENTFLIQAEGANKPVSTLKQIVIFTHFNSKKDRLLEALKLRKGQCIVFVNNQANSESVHHHIVSNGITTEVIHGALSTGHRERVLRDFRSEKFRVLVTTDLLARGLDIPNIKLIVNFDLPHEADDFLHRIGRTARAGKSGTAITLFTLAEEAIFKKFQPYLEQAEIIR